MTESRTSSPLELPANEHREFACRVQAALDNAHRSTRMVAEVNTADLAALLASYALLDRRDRERRAQILRQAGVDPT